MIPLVPKYATVHSAISAWARCDRINVKARHLRGNRASLLSHDFSLGAQAVKLETEVFKGRITAATLVDEHTHVPLYASLMSPLSALRWREHLLSSPIHRDTWAQGIRRLSTVEAPTLRRCPECVARDRVRYGCAHWRVFHQWPVARHCAEHGVPLETHCASCHAPFTRGHEASLADDPCLACGSDQGATSPYEAPAGYWPLLRRMYGLLAGDSEPTSEVARAVEVRGVDPAQMGSDKMSARLRATVARLLHQWNLTSMEQLAAVLGIDWIWFNEIERSSHMKGSPPLMTLALVSIGSLSILHSERDGNDGPSRLQAAATANTSAGSATALPWISSVTAKLGNLMEAA